jgi:predicted DNA-binding transcriptional regulator AlpA
MSTELEALLRSLLAHPATLGTLTPEQGQALASTLRTVMGVEQPPAPPAPTPATSAPAWSETDLLTVEEAAAALRVSPRWLYRHARTLPFTRKLSRKVLRFSRSGIARWLATKRL